MGTPTTLYPVHIFLWTTKMSTPSTMHLVMLLSVDNKNWALPLLYTQYTIVFGLQQKWEHLILHPVNLFLWTTKLSTPSLHTSSAHHCFRKEKLGTLSITVPSLLLSLNHKAWVHLLTIYPSHHCPNNPPPKKKAIIPNP